MASLTEALAPRSLQDNTPSSLTSALSNLPQDETAHHLFSKSKILAPMVRASTIPLRILALNHGATMTYTEELVDRSIFPTERIINDHLGTIDYRTPLHTFPAKVQKRMLADGDNPDSSSGAILLRIDPTKERDRLIYQIGTGESGLAVQAVEKVVGDVAGVDVNMGCPKKFSVSGGMGR
jgi:tRNA-dihydrouridine synthase 2